MRVWTTERILLNINSNSCSIVLYYVLCLCYKEKHGSRLLALLYSYTNRCKPHTGLEALLSKTKFISVHGTSLFGVLRPVYGVEMGWQNLWIWKKLIQNHTELRITKTTWTDNTSRPVWPYFEEILIWIQFSLIGKTSYWRPNGRTNITLSLLSLLRPPPSKSYDPSYQGVIF